jgi:hypothetical protein
MPGDANEFRTSMMMRLRIFSEALDQHMTALHQMYHDGLLPEKIYLTDVSMTSQEKEAIENAIQLIRMHRDTQG